MHCTTQRKIFCNSHFLQLGKGRENDTYSCLFSFLENRKTHRNGLKHFLPQISDLHSKLNHSKHPKHQCHEDCPVTPKGSKMGLQLHFISRQTTTHITASNANTIHSLTLNLAVTIPWSFATQLRLISALLMDYKLSAVRPPLLYNL